MPQRNGIFAIHDTFSSYENIPDHYFRFLVFQLSEMNVTNLTAIAGFVPNPPGRGTLGILWECTFTYFLCLWTAIHVDLEPGMLGLTSRSDSKFYWSLAIFFLPDVAFIQLLEQFGRQEPS